MLNSLDDKLLLKTYVNMKKNLVIGLLIILTISSFGYGYFQKQKAKEHEETAIENVRIVRELRVQLEESKKETEMQRKISIINEQRLMEQLEVTQKAIEALDKATKK